MHKIKSASVHGFKSLIGEGAGVFEAVVSVFGNVDYAGDRVLPGAFAASLNRWEESGDPIPIVFSHRWDDLDAHVGEVLESAELYPGDERLPEPLKGNGGLWIKGRLDVEEDFAGRLWKRLESRRIREFSFAYDVIDERRASDGANDLVALDVIEVGPTLKGMNPATALLDVKAFLAQAGANGAVDVAELVKALGLEDTKADDAGADGEKAWVNLAGSVEERQEDYFRAGHAWAADANIGDGGFYALYLEATFEGRAVVLVEGWNDPVGEGVYYELSFGQDDDGETIVTDATEVVVEGVARPKARRKQFRRDATGIGAGDGSPLPMITSDTVEAGDQRGKSNGKAEEPSGAKAEDQEARTDTGTTSGEAAKALVDIDILDIS